MENNLFNLNNKIYSNNNNIMLEIIKELNQLRNYSQDNLIISKLGNIINKINYIINDNKKNLELIRNDISSLEKRLNQKFDKLNINNNIIKNETKIYNNGKYIGQLINGKREGKGIYYLNSGSRYEGDWKNNKKEGKGIFYYKNGDREMGDYLNGKPIGKHVLFLNKGKITSKFYN